MARWARIENNTIQDIQYFDGPAPELEIEGMYWKEIPDNLDPYVDTSWVVEGEEGEDSFSPFIFDSLMDKIKIKIAARRWEMQTRGIIVGGFVFHSDNESLFGIDKAIRKGEEEVQAAVDAGDPAPEWSKIWKTKDGFTTLTLQQFKDIDASLTAYIESVFEREKNILIGTFMAYMENENYEEALTYFHAQLELDWPIGSFTFTI